MTRDPRVEPKVGDEVGFRDKPSRTVKLVFIDACGQPWVDYTITKQIPLSQWKRATRGAEVIHAAE